MGNDATVRIAGDVSVLLSALLSGKLGLRDFVTEFKGGMQDAAREANASADATGKLEGGMVGLIAKGTALGGILKDLAMGALKMVKDAAMGVVDAFMRGVSLSNEYNTALTGLKAVAAGTGTDMKATTDAAKELASSGLMGISSSATSLKNLLATGFSLPESIKLLKVAGDSAAFNRQGMLSYGEAVERFTQGIKFNNSALTDSTGLGKNLSVIMKEAGMSTDAAGNASSSAAVRQAILNGFMKEGALFTGNAAKYTETYGGQLARLTSAYDQFLATLGDAVTKNQTVITLMGIVATAFTDAGKGMDGAATMANLVSSAVILIVRSIDPLLSALDFLQQAWYQGKVASALFDAALQSIILNVNKAGLALLEFIVKIDPTGLAAKAFGGRIQEMKDQVNASEHALQSAADAAGKNEQKWKENSATIAGWKGHIAEVVTKLEATRGKLVEVAFATDNVNKHTEKAAALTKAQIAAAKRWQDVLDELNSAGANYTDTLESLDGEVVEAIKYYLEAGVSTAKLATAYGVTDVQIKAVVASMKDEKALLTILDSMHKTTYALAQKAEKDYRDDQAKQMKASNDLTVKSIEQTGKLWDEHYDAIAKETLSTTDYQIRKAQEWATDELNKLDKSDMNWRAHRDAIIAVEADKVRAIKLANNPIYQDWLKLTGDMKSSWDQLFVAAVHGADSFKGAIKSIFTTLKEDALQIFADILKAFVEGLIRKMILGGQQNSAGLASMFSGMGSGGTGGGSGGGSGGNTGGIVSGLINRWAGGGGSGGGAMIGGTAAADFTGPMAEGSGGAASGAGGASGGAMLGGGMMAAGGIYQMATAKTRGQNVMGGMQAGAGIGTMILPGWGTVIGAGVGALVGLAKSYMGVSQATKDARKDVATFEEQLAGTLTATQRLEAGNEPWKMSVIAVRDAYVATGKTEQEATDAVKTLWESSKGGAEATAAAMVPINDAMVKHQKLLDAAAVAAAKLYKQEHPDFVSLEGVANKYGITLAQLGAKFQQAHLTREAGEIMAAFKELDEAGANTDSVLAGMKDEIQGVVQNALAFGGSVPASMQPLIAQLILTGQLFDANGKAIKDISTIKFAPPIEDGAADAAGGIAGVGTAADGVTDRLAASGVAAKAWADVFVTEAERARRAVDTVSVGSSFGGIKEWVPMLRKSQQSFKELADSAIGHLGNVKKAINIGSVAAPGIGIGAGLAGAAAGIANPGGDVKDLHVHIHAIDGESAELATERTLLPGLIKVLGRGRGLRELKQVLSS